MAVENGFSSKYEDIVKAVAAENGIIDVNISLKDGVEGGINFLGDIHRFTVEGLKDGQRVEIHMIGKVISDSKVKRQVIPLDVFAKREFQAYEIILKELAKAAKEFNWKVSVNYPLCYRASADFYKEIILMEDLTYKGYEQCRDGKVLDLDHSLLLLEQMARYHALSFVFKQKFTEKYEKMSEGLTDMLFTHVKNIEQTIEAAVEYAKKHIRNDCVEEVVGAFQKHNITEKNRYLLDGRNEEYSIICHGDLWTHNLMYRYKDNKPTDVMLLDWQCIRYSSPVTDLYFAIFISVHEKVRERSFQKLLDTYYDRLKTNIRALEGDPDVLYPEHIFREHILKYSYTGFSSALIMLTVFHGAGMPSEDEMEEAFEKKGTLLAGEQPTTTYITQIRRTINDIKQNNLHSLW